MPPPSAHLPSRSRIRRLYQWLDGVATPSTIATILAVWFLVALCLHLLLDMDPKDEFDVIGNFHFPQNLVRRGQHGRHGGHRQNHHNNHEQPLNDGRNRANPPPPYQNLVREKYEKQYPPTDTDRIKNFVASLRDDRLDSFVGDTTTAAGASLLPYDPLDCPDAPPPDYPLHYSLIKVLEDWPVDVLEWPDVDANGVFEHPYLFHSLCIFDWQNPQHRSRITAYQADYDVPFLVRNHPTLLQTTERWMRDDPAYLRQLVGEEPQKTEHSKNNHLPFWRLPRKQSDGPLGWEAPTDNQFMSFDEWSSHADALKDVIAQHKDHTQHDHYYFRLNGDVRHNAYLYDELPIFDPTRTTQAGKNVFLWEPDAVRGINCRFGAAGNVAEAHYDDGRNWIVLTGGGQRRYILAHPRQCPHLALYRPGHPSARHSQANWSEIRNDGSNGPEPPAYHLLQDAQVTQVVLQASDALFIPTYWFHFIVSLNRNYQCNARSGRTDTYSRYIDKCGFPAG